MDIARRDDGRRGADAFARYGTVPGKRILIAGNGPLNVQVAAELLKAGAEVIAWLRGLLRRGRSHSRRSLCSGLIQRWRSKECGCFLGSSVPELMSLAVACRVDHRTRQGRKRTCQGGPRAQPSSRSTRFCLVVILLLPVNFLGCSVALIAMVQTELRAECDGEGMSSRPDVYVIGEARRFAGAQLLWPGAIAGRAMRERSASMLSRRQSHERKLARAKSFQQSLWQLFAPSTQKLAVDDYVLVWPRESVQMGTLKAAARQGPPDIATLSD